MPQLVEANESGVLEPLAMPMRFLNLALMTEDRRDNLCWLSQPSKA